MQFKDRQELMTSLSKIILGEEALPEDFTFEILEESSILGDEQNFIDIDEVFLTENMRSGKEDFIAI